MALRFIGRSRYNASYSLGCALGPLLSGFLHKYVTFADTLLYLSSLSVSTAVYLAAAGMTNKGVTGGFWFNTGDVDMAIDKDGVWDKIGNDFRESQAEMEVGTQKMSTKSIWADDAIENGGVEPTPDANGEEEEEEEVEEFSVAFKSLLVVVVLAILGCIAGAFTQASKEKCSEFYVEVDPSVGCNNPLVIGIWYDEAHINKCHAAQESPVNISSLHENVSTRHPVNDSSLHGNVSTRHPVSDDGLEYHLHASGGCVLVRSNATANCGGATVGGGGAIGDSSGACLC